jgi:hypothetical protein
MAKMGRPVGSGKPPGEKFVMKTFRFPPALWKEFADAVPMSLRSATIRGYMEEAIQKSKRQRGSKKDGKG